LVRQYKPKALVAFGGYPTLPPLQAAKRAGVPIVLQEQNAVLGRANKLFATSAAAIATGFPLLDDDGALAAKTIVSGNPVRPPVLEAAKQAYGVAGNGGAFNLLIFGGSQGAQYFSQVLPKALALMPKDLQVLLKVTQQARAEDEASLIKAYADLNIEAEVSPFFNDMPGRIAASHLVICRAGASTVSELAVIGRPSILVPYPFALDHDQAANAAELAGKGGASIVPQSELDGEKLASMLVEAMNNPQDLAVTAANAKLAGLPDAATKLADMVEHVAKGGGISQFKGQTK
jgi:UDP-N-acetylglucosamine--N-acetylmuramyl-(pentapeptide) pyrophosphoryl-undecaprenol N-acetylglucosamine transferase